MNGEDLVLVDTSAWIEALRPNGDRGVREKVAHLLEDGRAAWCDIICLELWHGARGKPERAALGEFQRTLTCFAVDQQVWRVATRLATRARDVGLTAPTADLIIAACAFHYKLPMVHTDKHLTALEKLG